MSESKVEEILSMLGFVVAGLAYGLGFKATAVFFAAKATFDAGCAVYYGYKEARAEINTNKAAKEE